MSNKQKTSKNVLFDTDDALYELLQATKENTDNTYYLEIIDTLHQLVHDKKMNTISYTKESVAAGGTLRVRIVATTKDIHARLAYTGEFKTRLRSYVGTTYAAEGDGTIYTPFNRHTAEAENIEGTIYIDPVIAILGTRRGNDFVGAGGATPSRVGGTGSEGIETVIDAGTELLIEVINADDTSASDLNLIGNIYEVTPSA